MDFKDLVRIRTSIRQYSDKQVERELLEQVLDAGRMAPSAVNFQPWDFIVLRDPENLDAIKACYHREWFKSAPVVIVVCGNHKIGWHRQSDGKDHTDIDVAIAVDHMTLQAAELGLATCWVCNFDPKLCSKRLNLPPYIEPVVLLPVGYPSDSEEIFGITKKRKDLLQVVHWEKYSG